MYAFIQQQLEDVIPRLTVDFESTILRCSNDVEPSDGQDGNPEHCLYAGEHRQHEEDRENKHVVQVEECEIVLQASHQQRRAALHIKGSLLAKAEKHRQSPQMLPVQYLLSSSANEVLRSLRNRRGNPRNNLIPTT